MDDESANLAVSVVFLEALIVPVHTTKPGHVDTTENVPRRRSARLRPVEEPQTVRHTRLKSFYMTSVKMAPYTQHLTSL